MTQPLFAQPAYRHLKIHDAKREWADAIWDVPGGVICPVCDRLGKVYSRRFGLPMAKSLVWIYRVTQGDEWVHIPTKGTREQLRANNWGHLTKFGVLEAMPPDKDSKTHHTGYYRITAFGRCVVRGELKIPEYIFTYNDERIEPRGEVGLITLREAGASGGSSFDEIMQAALDACK